MSSRFFDMLLHSSPAILAYLVGIILSLVFWARNPKVGGLTLVSMCICIFAIVLYPTVMMSPLHYRLSRMTHMTFNELRITLIILRNVIQAAGLGILLLAAFTMREPAHQQQGFMVQPMGGPPLFRRG